MLNVNFLEDREFLKKLDLYNEKTIYVKIISLDFDENPIEEIQGKVTSGNISLDGKSSVRRTCSLSLISEDININDYYWALNTKISIYIGVENKIDKIHDPIIWFPQGIYLLTSFSVSYGVSSCTISVQGKDKMCLLNGEIGGLLTAPITFGEFDNVDEDGNVISTDFVPIKDIIQGIVHTYANEPLSNIVINDLDIYAYTLLENRDNNNESVYYFLSAIDKTTIADHNSQVLQRVNKAGYIYFKHIPASVFKKEDNVVCFVNGERYLLSDLNDLDGFEFYSENSLLNEGVIGTPVKLEKNSDLEYYVVRRDYGDTIGYSSSELFYSSLAGNTGESFTSILDKIVNYLGNFEYFYDLNGRFIFQKIKNYTTTAWSNIILNQDKERYAEDVHNLRKTEYDFTNNQLITNINNNPNLMDLKNDFSIWGMNSVNQPIHLRYAIDKKPELYVNFKGEVFVSTEKSNFDFFYAINFLNLSNYLNFNSKFKTKKDFLIYNEQQTKSKRLKIYISNDEATYTPLKEVYYYDKTKKDFFRVDGKISKNTIEKENLFLTERTPISKEYHLCDWREIIYQMARDYNEHHLEDDFYVKIANNNVIEEIPSGGIEPEKFYYYPKGITGYEKYYQDLEGFWRMLYNPDAEDGTLTNYYQEFDFYNISRFNYAKLFSNASFKNINLNSNTGKNTRDSETWKVRYGIEDNKKFILLFSDTYVYDFSKNYSVEQKSIKNFVLNDYRIFLDSWDDFLQIDFDKGGLAIGEEKIMMPVYCNFNSQLGMDITKYFKNVGGVLTPLSNADKSKMYIDNVYTKINELYLESQDFILDVKKAPEKDVYVFDNMFIYQNLTNNYYPIRNNTKVYYNYIPDNENFYIFDIVHRNIYNIGNQGSPKKNDINLSYYERNQSYKKGWTDAVTNAPDSILFWIDFLDTQGDIGKYSVQKIGDRQLVKNDNNIKAISYDQTPYLCLVKESEWDDIDKDNDGYQYVKVRDSFFDNMGISSRGTSAKDTLDNFLANNTYCSESISVTSIPIFYLEPNTLISIYDETSHINGDYLVSQLGYSLGTSGTMSISATKIPDSIW